ncbi:uncharacterized protein ARMOST_15849 [Armillaria ostoyae]|uniref:UBC core domain-containing protein n=1 Tax=Armillaria ostoyae TaxID=47428 RepID=A0A284RUL4_ARMOS|nr:uncharacterized protein ARMOST_15849 [Armillaria ostoyae]
MATKAASKRLSKEYVTMQREPPFVWAVPDKKNISTWNYIIIGGTAVLYSALLTELSSVAHLMHPSPAENMHHGLLLFPSEYPFKPPGIKMLTRSGRFLPDKKIGFSMSDFYPGSWNPAWSVATILTGLLSFMLSDEMTTGSAWFKDAFPDISLSVTETFIPTIMKHLLIAMTLQYCTPQPRDLPNISERERGIIKTHTCDSLPFAPQPTTPAPQTVVAKPAPPPTPAVTLTAPTVSADSAPRGSIGKPDEAANAVGWASGWSQLFRQKWRWGILIALAVITLILVVSLYSSPLSST